MALEEQRELRVNRFFRYYGVRSFRDYTSFFRVLLPCLGWRCLLDNVQSKAIRLIKNPNLTKSLQPLSYHHLVEDLSIFYRYFHGHCSQEIREIIPVPLRRVRTTRSSFTAFPSFTPYFTNSIPQIIIHT